MPTRNEMPTRNKMPAKWHNLELSVPRLIWSYEPDNVNIKMRKVTAIITWIGGAGCYFPILKLSLQEDCQISTLLFAVIAALVSTVVIVLFWKVVKVFVPVSRDERIFSRKITNAIFSWEWDSGV